MIFYSGNMKSYQANNEMFKELEMIKRLNKQATMSDYTVATMFLNLVVFINVF